MKPVLACGNLVIGLLLILALGYIPVIMHTSYSATPAQLANATDAINSAFVSVHNAEKNGGNVTPLVSELNVAISLVQKAQLENSTDPSKASIDLLEATQIANEANASSTLVAKTGLAATNLRITESVCVVIAIIFVTIVIYIYGERLYRLAWSTLYKNYQVRLTDE